MAEKGSVLDRILTGVLVAAAVAVAGVAVRRELSSDGAVPRSASVAGPAGDSLTDPSSLERAARPLSTRRGTVRVVVFTDLECPACRTFHRSLMEHTASDAADVDVALVHFPLPQHRFASMAAAMAECAAAEGRFRPMVEVLFASQDSLGLKSWPRLATEAGLREPGRILSCIEGSEARTAVAEGKRLG